MAHPQQQKFVELAEQYFIRKHKPYDITISCNCFEHNPYWRETFLNMHRMTKEGGLCLSRLKHFIIKK